MSRWFKYLLIANSISLLLACSDDPKRQTEQVPTPSPVPIVDHKITTVPATRTQKQTNNLSVVLWPKAPTSSDCLKAITYGQPNRIEYQWVVSGTFIQNHSGSTLCNEFFKRGDEVTVSIGEDQDRVSTSVTIGNSPPKITEVTATSNHALQHKNLTIDTVAKDPDNDEIKFRYQWLINGEEDVFHVDSTLPGNAYNKGDTIRVKITPYDGFSEGTTYESAKLTVPNAPPDITSKPPQQFEAFEYTYQVEVTDPDDTELTYSLEEAPQEMTIDGAGRVTWPLTEVRAGTYKVKIAVTDPEGAKTTQEFSVTLGRQQE